jgi:hypothetical protein
MNKATPWHPFSASAVCYQMCRERRVQLFLATASQSKCSHSEREGYVHFSVALKKYSSSRYNGPLYNERNLAVYNCEFLEMLKH